MGILVRPVLSLDHMYGPSLGRVLAAPGGGRAGRARPCSRAAVRCMSQRSEGDPGWQSAKAMRQCEDDFPKESLELTAEDGLFPRCMAIRPSCKCLPSPGAAHSGMARNAAQWALCRHLAVNLLFSCPSTNAHSAAARTRESLHNLTHACGHLRSPRRRQPGDFPAVAVGKPSIAGRLQNVVSSLTNGAVAASSPVETLSAAPAAPAVTGEAVEYDPLRDGPLRYLGYANEASSNKSFTRYQCR